MWKLSESESANISGLAAEVDGRFRVGRDEVDEGPAALSSKVGLSTSPSLSIRLRSSLITGSTRSFFIVFVRIHDEGRSRTPRWTFCIQNVCDFFMILIFRIGGVVFLCDPLLDLLVSLLQIRIRYIFVAGLFMAVCSDCDC